MAVRIQARAIRRCGELLKVFDGKANNQHSAPDGTKRKAAADAGLSMKQQTTAGRVATPQTSVIGKSDPKPSACEILGIWI